MVIEKKPSKQRFMSKAGSWKFISKGLPFLAVGGATFLLAYKVQQIKFEFGPSSCTLADAEEISHFLESKGIGNQQKSIEAVYQELVKKDGDSWENIRGPRDSEDNKEFLQLNISATERGAGSSGDFSEAPPPPPGFPNTSREAVRGSERTPVISSPASSDFPHASTNERVNIQIIADPTIDRQANFPSSSASASQSQLTQSVLDPASSSISSVETVVPTQPFYVPAVPDFNQETLYTTAESSQSVTSNLLDPDISLTQTLVAGTSCSHPADPENKEDLVDPILLSEILQLGFEEAIAVLAISKTKEIGGAEAAINWILEHSNESDFESDEEQNSMGGANSTNAINRQHKMVFVVNMSLKMGVGKLAAQVGHATLGVYRLALRSEEGQRALDAWRTAGEMKVVVKGHNTEMLLDFFKQSKDLGLFAYIVSDAGRTQIPAGSRTVLGIFGPTHIVDLVTGELKLL
uniref:peptidyl-tRNA hydrolase n=1 Tax=Elaeophora elaphi TaxID=1147741 RepID=A0A158Q834_9BILA